MEDSNVWGGKFPEGEVGPTSHTVKKENGQGKCRSLMKTQHTLQQHDNRDVAAASAKQLMLCIDRAVEHGTSADKIYMQC